MRADFPGDHDRCPCGSGQTFGGCCGPFLSGLRPAPTAEALMRSRFTAYVLHLDDYVLATWHPQTRPAALFGADEARPRWTALQILGRRAGGERDAEGWVEFTAGYETEEGPGALRELSRFSRVGGAWRYESGVHRPANQAVSAKAGRNDPCPCGSGKKHKQCCGR